MPRKLKVPINDLTGGEASIFPPNEMPPKYSLLLQNLYISENGQISTMPGYEIDSPQDTAQNIKSGVEFTKSDGTKERLIAGLGISNYVSESFNGIYVHEVSFTGAGLNDLSTNNVYTGSVDATFEVEIDATGTPDTFRWRKDGGSWTSGVAITGAAQSLSDGVTVTFAATTGHTITDLWTIETHVNADQPDDMDVVSETYFSGSEDTTYEIVIDSIGTPDTFRWRYYTVSGGWSSWTTGVSITGGEQTLNNNVKIIFESTTGHVFGQYWTIIADYQKTSGHIFRHYYVASVGTYDKIKTNLDNDAKVYFTVVDNEVYMANGVDQAMVWNGDTSTLSYVVQRYIDELTFTGSGIDDLSIAGQFAGRVLDDINYEFEITEAYKLKYVGAEIYVGSGINDLSIVQSYNGSGQAYYEVEIQTSATPDTFRWRKDDGAWVTAVPIDSTNGNELAGGLIIKFAVDNGHTVATKWIIIAKEGEQESVYFSGAGLNDLTSSGSYIGTEDITYLVEIDSTSSPDTFRWRYQGRNIWQEEIPITGANQFLDRDIYVSWATVQGHTVGDKWTLTATIGAATTEVFTGVGVDDLTPSGQLENTGTVYIVVKISQGGTTTNEFRWKRFTSSLQASLSFFNNPEDFNGYSEPIAITGNEQFLEKGVYIKFTNTTGHSDTTLLRDRWKITAPLNGSPSVEYAGNGINDLTAYNENKSPVNMEVEIDSQGGNDSFKWKKATATAWNILNNITGAAQALENGVQVTFGAVSGHTVGTYWEVPCYAQDTYKSITTEQGGTTPKFNIFGLYTGIDDTADYEIEHAFGTIDANAFRWRKNGGAWSDAILINGYAQDIEDGIKVQFETPVPQAIGSPPRRVKVDISKDKFKYRKDNGAWTEDFIRSDDPDTTETQEDEIDIGNGLTAKFDQYYGHTVGDSWIYNLDMSNLIKKFHIFKNRLWAVLSNNKMLAIYSGLNAPQDFQTSNDAGFLDFKYVLDVSDELVDIATYVDLIVFFFKNNILIYSGTNPNFGGDFVNRQSITDVGLLAPATILQTGAELVFLNKDGIKTLNQVVTTGALNAGNLSTTINDYIVQAIADNTNELYGVAHYPKLAWYIFLIGDIIWVYNYARKEWQRMVTPATDKTVGIFSTNEGDVFMGGEHYLYKYGESARFGTSDMTCIWESGWVRTSQTGFGRPKYIDILSSNTDTAQRTVSWQIALSGYDIKRISDASINSGTYDTNINTSDFVYKIPAFNAGNILKLRLQWIINQSTLKNHTIQNVTINMIESAK
jgi:hypothetical protein